nr:twin-arginine translocation signal domain-containing protein [Deltaproteobacteria bacterium]
MHQLSRRTFLKLTGAAAAGVTLTSLGFDLRPVHAYAKDLRILHAKQTNTICPYCAVGCGIIVHTIDG